METAQSKHSSNRLVRLTVSAYVAGGLILAALLAQFAIFASTADHATSVPLDIVIFASLAALFVLLGFRFIVEGQRARAAAAFVGAVCWMVYVGSILTGFSR